MFNKMGLGEILMKYYSPGTCIHWESAWLDRRLRPTATHIIIVSRVNLPAVTSRRILDRFFRWVSNSCDLQVERPG